MKMKIYNFFPTLFKSLSRQVNQSDLDNGRLYPPLKAIPEVSVQIAREISEWYYNNGYATYHPRPKDMEEHIRSQLYDTKYGDYQAKQWQWPHQHEQPRES